MATTQERLHEILMERVRSDRYPSHQLLDRIEVNLFSAEQVIEYVELLLEKVDQAWYPSGQLLDRLQRIMAITAMAGRRAA